MVQHAISSLEGYLLVRAYHACDEMKEEKQVIFVFSHNTTGAMGIALHKTLETVEFDTPPTTNMSSDGLLQDVCVYEGGETEADQSFILHTNEWISAHSFPAKNPFVVTRSQDFLPPHDQEPKNFLIALGYFSWPPGGLEDEMESGLWLVTPATKNLVFSTPPEQKWHTAMRNLGIYQPYLTVKAGHA